MNLQNTVLNFFVGVIPVISVTYIIIGIILLKHKGKNKVNYFSFLLFACAIYSFGYFLELNCTSLDTAVIMRIFSDLGSVFIPSFGILFIAQLTAVKVKKRTELFLFAFSAFLWFIYITNPIHNLFYRSLNFKIIQGFAVTLTVKGPLYYLMMAYYAFLFVFSSIILAKKYKTSKIKNDKNSFLFMFTAFQIPWLGILIIVFGFDKYFDPAPVIIMIMCGLFMINEIKNDMFKLLIRRWKSDYDLIEDPALLIDEERKIVCLNTAGNSIFDKQETGSIVYDLDKSKSDNSPFAVAMNDEVRYFTVRKNYYNIKKSYTTYLLIDITEQKLTEKAILKSESGHKAMIAGISDVISIMGADGKMKYISPNVEKYYGWLPEEIIGTDMKQTIHPDDMEWLQNEYSKILSKDHASATVKFRFRCKDGTYKWIEITGTNLVRDESINGVLMNYHDITDRKRAEDELKESEKRFRELVQNFDAGMVIHAPDSSIIDCNDRAFYILGMSSDQIKGKTATDSSWIFVDEDESPLPLSEFPINLILDGKYPIKNKIIGVVQSVSGNIIWASVNGIPLLNKTGEITEVVISFIDITQRKQAEAALKESEEKFKNIFTVESDTLLVIDRETGDLLDANDSACLLYGYTKEEMLLMKCTDMSFEPEQTEKAMKGPEKFIPLRYHKKKDGTVFPVEISSSLFTFRNRETLITASRDITERKQAEQLIAQTRQNYETFFNSIDDFLFVLDEQGCILHTNSTVIKRLGYTAEELLGESVLMMHPSERRTEAGRIVDEMLRGITEFCSVPVITKTGQQIPVETRISHGIWDNNPAIFGVSKDISKITLSEEKFKKLFYLNPSACGLSDLDDGKYIEVNEAFYHLFGFEKWEVIGHTAMELGILSDITREIILEKADADGKITGVETSLKAKSGEIIHVMLSAENIYVQDKKYRFTVVHDITDNKRKQEQIEFLSYHDQLTGIYNRRYYDKEILRLNDEKYFPLTLVMVDVNGLKLTNDAFGHKAGDLLLRRISEILKSECRKDDIIARIGGDEFVLLLPETDAVHAEIIIDRINTAIKNENIRNVILSVSMGYAVKKSKSEDMDEIFMKAEDDMYRHKLTESSSMRSKSIDLIMNSLFEKNNREMLHSRRVGEICAAIAEKMSFTKDEINETKTAGLMHDIGKIGINEMILNKPDKLNMNEWNEIERHSEIGYRILSSVNEFSQIANYILEHHEKWDGTGYPKKLKADEISLQARIIAVADSYDAMTTERSYRKALRKDVAIAELRKYAGTQFDPEVVDVFIEKVLEKSVT